MSSTDFLIFVCVIYCSYGNTEHPASALRFCGSALNRSYEIYDTSCRRGIWTPNPVLTDCICATGTWMLMGNYCDPSFYIISGPPPSRSPRTDTQFTCFHIPQEFRRFIFLSEATTKYKEYIVHGNGIHIEADEEQGPPYFTKATTPIVVIRLNAINEIYLQHKTGVHSEIWQKCAGTRRLKPYIHILKSEETLSVIQSLIGEESCDDMKDADFPFTMSNNTEWIISKLGSYGWGIDTGLVPASDCTCPPSPQGHNDVTARGSSVPGEGQSLLRNSDQDYDSMATDAWSLFPSKKDPMLHNEHLKDLQRMTASILSKLKDILFSGAKPTPYPNPLFNYFRIGRKILSKYCPEVPADVVKNLIAMFRLLLTDVARKHPEEYNLNYDSGQHARVIQSLNGCLNAVQTNPVSFTWSEEISKSSFQCKREIVAFTQAGKTTTLSIKTLPHDLTFVDGDVMLEIAWKIVLVMHYACTEVFQAYPEDLSLMYEKAMKFLTIPSIMFRWENSPFGLSVAYKILAPNLKAEELGQQVDACLLAAYEKSSFKMWINRPISGSEFIPEAVVMQSMGKLAGNGSSNLPGHSSAHVAQDHFGICVNDFNDPITMSLAEEHMAETIGITGCQLESP